jgi:hypothetical protein
VGTSSAEGLGGANFIEGSPVEDVEQLDVGYVGDGWCTVDVGLGGANFMLAREVDERLRGIEYRLGGGMLID